MSTDSDKDLAREQWDAQREYFLDSEKGIRVYGTLALRSPALAASAGIAALLAFGSANSVKLKSSIALGSYTSSLSAFFVCVVLSVVATFFAYFSQASLSSRYGEEVPVWEHPFYQSNTASKIYSALNWFFRWAAILAALASLFMLSRGCLQFYRFAIFQPPAT